MDGPRRALLLVLIGLALSFDVAMRAQAPSAASRRIVVLSDLHMGGGRDARGTWLATEDFRWAAELELFLTALSDERDATDLILNGDTFDLTQSAEVACAHVAADLGCTEPEALARLERVLGAHVRELEAFGAFAGNADNRVVIVPGDHDAALLFPAVGDRAVAAFGSPGRVTVAMDGVWRSRDGLVHAEHGHQIEGRADRFEGWPEPFITRSGRRHLARPWGQQLMQALFDEHEPRFPVIDNLADDSAGLRYALSAGGADDIGVDAASLLRLFLFRSSWQQFRMDLDRGDVEAPVWDLAAVRAQGAGFLVDSLPDDDRFKPLAARALDDGHLDRLMGALTDDELRAVCDRRAAVRRARRRFERILTQLDPTGPPVAECARTPETTESRFEYFWQSRDRLALRHLERIQDDRRRVAVFVHGHTHLADYRQGNFTRVEAGRAYVVDGFSPVRDAVTPVVINAGAWQRTVTPVALDRFQEARGVSDAELLATLRPEQLAPCYSFVQIDPYTDQPGPPMLRYWRQDVDGVWSMAGACARQISE